MNYSKGESIYKYQLLSYIGGGAFGEVWLTIDKSLDAQCALKLLPQNDTSIDERLLEAKIGFRLQHPNVVNIKYADIIQHGNPPAPIVTIAMPFYQQGSVVSKLNSCNFLDTKTAVTCLIDVLRGLEYLHENGYFHCDIKPNNILIGDHNEFILSDYGITCFSPEHLAVRPRQCYLPHTAPETYSKNIYDERTDIYQIGLTAFRLFNGISEIKAKFLEDREKFRKSVMEGKVITDGDRELFHIQSIFAFRARSSDYWHICFEDGSGRTYEKRSLKIEVSCLGENKAGSRLDYLRQLAAINELKSDDGTVLLEKQYEKLTFVGQDTAMAVYLDPTGHCPDTRSKYTPIYPFGGNASQFHAVSAALENQISVIQGPPGTGKTQTILNIIANLLATGKTILVVSNNNSATENVLEKLSDPKNALGFLVAPLGKGENKTAFIQGQTGLYPKLSEWKQSPERQVELKGRVASLSVELSELFAKQERLATAKQELNALTLEMKYFADYCKETGIDDTRVKLRRDLKSQRLMQLWQECCAFSDEDRSITLWFKLKSVLVYGISDWKFYQNNLPRIITMLQGLYYQTKKAELEFEIADIEKLLIENDAKNKMDELTKLSTRFLHAVLSAKYVENQSRRVFTDDDLWQHPMEVLKEYPIVLSTTFSSRSSLKDATYDYLIMDEASQVDVATGALALSCAKNAVIVGDLKQLPNVVTDEMKRRSNAVFSSFDLPAGYSFYGNSFLKSVCSVVPNVPQTLLREHYRCHPKIIGFCNQKFYQNELVIMTEDHGEPDVLKVFLTNMGNHRRDHINQRQIDVTVQEVLPQLDGISPKEIGIVAPYRDQVFKIEKELGKSKIEVHTVHKFQGREKDTIVLTTVDDVITDFSDDPYLLNVAVSRAKKQLMLVVSGDEQPADSNIGDLISYIRYNNCEIVQSELYSVFDLLYSQYTDARIAYLRKHKQVSEYDSENLMYGAICDLLDARPQLSLGVICHQPLNMLIRDPHRLNDDECRYAMNTATHLDFLIYHRISRKPVLAIEVDGFHFHKQGTAQYNRDRMKDHILQLYKIPAFRFSTNGSGEIEKIAQALDAYAQMK